MKKKKQDVSSKRWLKEHFDDHYVQQAKKLGRRSRASFKIEEIQQKDGIIRSGDVVVDLGAAPGGWSEYAIQQVGHEGRVIACDILHMESIHHVEFLQGDFTNNDVFEQLLTLIGEESVDVILSDMAPNLSGNAVIDQSRSMMLVELALDMCYKVLKAQGTFVVKAFQGQDFDPFLYQLRQQFKMVKIRKPDSSRARSKEVYLVATCFIGQ